MKSKVTSLIIVFFSFSFLLLFETNGECQEADTTSNLYLKNINYVDCKTIEFEIWIEYTGNVPQKFSYFQAGIDFDYAGMANGGLITGAFVPGTGDPSLPISGGQQSPNWHINQTSKQIRMLSAIAAPSSSALVLPLPPGIRLGKFRMINSVNFSSGATPNFVFKYLTGTNTTSRTLIGLYLNGSTQGSDATHASHQIVEGNPPFSCIISCSVFATLDQITAPKCIGLSNGSARVTLTGSGFSSNGNYILDGLTPVTYSSNPFIITGLSEGSHTVIVNTNIPCTSNTAQFAINPGANIDDNNFCTTDGCNTATGVFHNPVITDDFNVCTTDACTSSTGVITHTPVNTDDGNVCTTDACISLNGLITHTTANIEDGNLCTTDACNSSTGTITHTLVNADDGNVCTTDACNSLNGLITHTIAHFEDGNLCTIDACNSLINVVTITPVNTDDGNLCTIDACISSTGIITHTAVNIEDGNLCTTDACNTVTGSITHIAINTNDGNPCTIDGCDSSNGVFHIPIIVDDGNACTIDGCNFDTITITTLSEGNGDPTYANFPFTWASITSTTTFTQVFLPVNSFPEGYGIIDFEFDLNMAHTWGTDIFMYLRTPSSPPLLNIEVGLLNPTSVAKIEFGQTPGGFIPTAPYHWSNTGTNIVLSGSVPSPGNLVPVIPYNQSHHSATPMSFSVFNGRNPNGSWILFFIDPYNQDGGTFEHAKLKITATSLSPTITHTPINIDDGNVCTTDGCDSATGIFHNTINADDNNACTIDGCDSLTGLISHNLVSIDDNNECTIDGCDSATGIFHNTVNADDNDACTIDGCDSLTGLISHNLVSIDDNNECTIDGCDSLIGVFHNPVNTDDNDACTIDGCDSLTGLISHSPVNIDDNNVCTTDACNSLNGPTHVLNPIENDNNACTTDGCDPISGEYHNLIIISTYIYASICQGQNYMLPWGGSVTSAGDYSNAYSSFLLCDSIVTIHLVVNPLPIPTASSNSPLSIGNTLNLSSSGGANYSWTGPNAYTSTHQNPSILNVTVSNSGNYIVTVTNENGCSSSATTIVTVQTNQVPNSYNCYLKNITYTDSKHLEFDIWLEWTGTNANKFLTFQAGINFNYAGMANGGTITGAFVAGSADPSLPASQKAPNWNVNQTSKQIRMIAALATPVGIAVPIPAPPGIRLGKFKMTNTADFPCDSVPNFKWHFQTGSSSKTKTDIAFYIGNATTGVFITDSTKHNVEPNLPFSICFTSCAVVTTLDQTTPPVCLGGSNGSARVNLSGSGTTATGSYIIDGLSPIPFATNPFIITGLSEGSHTVIVNTNIPCTSNTAQFTISPGANIDDNDACTTDACDSITGVSHLPVDRNDNNACTVDLCDPLVGVFHVPLSIDDGTICTIDACNTSTGVITHTNVSTDDSNACTIDGCNSITGFNHDAVNVNDGNACTLDACNTITGEITNTEVFIDDNYVCTTDACNTSTGVIAHTNVNTDDFNACTTDGCNSSSGVFHSPVNVDDGNACTINVCNSSTGVITHTAISTDDNNACTTDACNTSTGAITNTNVNTDDGNACTTDGCNTLSGIFHNPVNVNDGNACTIDACNSSTGAITHTAEVTDDNNACTTDACNSSTGVITHTNVSTDDGNACTTDDCNTSSGIFHNPVNVSDGNACTFDACNSSIGSITHTVVVTDDNNACTTDACNTSTGDVTHTDVNTDDSNACTTDACNTSTGVVSHTAVDPNDGNACTTDACDPSTGVSNTLVNIIDGNACTIDACDPSTGIITHTDDSPLVISTSGTIACFGGSTCVTVSATGGQTPYFGTDVFCGYGMGSYSLEVTDGKGCKVSSSVTITEPTKLTVTATSTPSSGTDGTTTASPNGGMPAYSYLWTPGGQTISTAMGLTPGYYCVKVTDANGCTTTSCTSVYIIDNCNLNAPGNINGPVGICKKQTGIVYCVTAPNPLASSYVWSFPTGASTIGATNGPCITLKFSTKFKGGFIYAKANLWCGTTASAYKNIVLINKKATTPGFITGSSSLCPNQSATYSISPVADALNYEWNEDHLIILSGQGTTSVLVKAEPGFNGGKIKVKAINCKGNSGERTFNISKSLACRLSDNISFKETFNSTGGLSLVSAFPNPTSGKLTVSFYTESKSKITLKVIDLLGKSILTNRVDSVEGENTKSLDLSYISKGMYFLTIEIEGIEAKTLRVVVE